MRKFAALAMIYLVLLTTSRAGIPINFSGTPGLTPVSLTISNNVDFTVTVPQTMSAYIIFVISDLFATSDTTHDFVNITSSPLYISVNGGSLQTSAIGWADNGYTGNDVSSTDGYFYLRINQNILVGDVITLHAGTMTSNQNAPAQFHLGSSGVYNMFITTISGSTISTQGTSVPEPTTYALVALGLAGAALLRKRK